MADINPGSTGSGRPASEPAIWSGHLASRAAGTGPTGGAFGESSQELESFIRTATKGKSAISELLGILSGDGKTKVSNFTGAIKSLNTELKRAVDFLRQAKDGAGNLPAGLGGGVSSGGNGGDVRFPPAPTSSGGDGPSGGGGGPGSPPPPPPNGGWVRPAVQVGAALAGVGLMQAGRSFANRLESATYLDTLTRQQMIAGGGTQGSWSSQYSNMFRGTAIGGFEGLSAADAALVAGGVGRGTSGYMGMMRGVGMARHAMPGADVGAMAGGAATMQHGQVAQGLRLRGITTFNMSYPEQMRKVLRAANGGREVTQELLSIARPGTMYYDNLMALLGDDPSLVAQVLEFGRADARGRAAGVDVTTRAGATRIGLGDKSIEGRAAYAAGSKAAYQVADQMENLNKNVTEMYRNMEAVNEQLARLPEPLKNLWNGIGQWTAQFSQFTSTTGLGGLVNAMAPVAGGYLAGGGWGKVKAAGARVFNRGAVAAGDVVDDAARTARSAGSSVGRVGSWLARGANALGVTAFAWGNQSANASANRSVQPGVDYERDVEMYGRGAADAIQRIIETMPAGTGHDWNPETRARRRAISEAIQEAEPRGGLDTVHGADHEGEGVSRRGFGGVKPHVAAAGNYLAQKFGPFPGGIGGVGKRSNKSDHPAGLALDFMTNNNTALGDRLVNYLTKNAKHFGVKYIIWKQKINTGSGWRQMEDRGSPTANHMDHPHVSFYPSPSSGQEFSDEGGFGSSTGGEEAAASAIARLSGGMGSLGGGRSELEIFSSFFGGAHGGASSGSAATSALGTGDSDPSFGSFQGGAGRLSDTELMQVLQQAGFSGQGLITAFAVARAESGGDSRAFNGNAATGDKSYGLFQINMLDKLGPSRRKAYGLSSNEDLYDPVTNARIAYQMSNGGTKWKDWSVHPHAKARGGKGSGYEQYLDDAKAAFSGAGTGASAEPRGGLETGGADVGYVTPAPPPSRASSGGGARNVNVTLKIERATYDEAEKFAGWVMGFMEKKTNLATIGGR